MADFHSSFYFENKKHGTESFEFNLYPCTIPLDFESVPMHYQNTSEIIFVKKGCGIVRVEEHRFQAGAGDVFFLPKGTLHALQKKSGYSMEYENIIFDLKQESPFKPMELPPAYLTSSMVGYSEIHSILLRIESVSKFRRDGYELGIRGLLEYFLYLLTQSLVETSSKETRSAQRLKNVLDYIDLHFKEPITIEEVAAYVHLSSGHFMKFFKETTGDSFTSYLLKRRLKEATDLLEMTDHKVVDIAEECGYDNLSNFNRQFKKVYGVTPRAYRKAVAEQK